LLTATFEPGWNPAEARARNAIIDLFEKGQEGNLQTLNFTAKRNGGNCYEYTNAND
jgi:hypothetical protein